jgi:hypothetical protein
MNESPRSAEDRRPVALEREGASEKEVTMVPLLKRHQVQAPIAAGHRQAEVSVFSALNMRSVRRIAAEPSVEHADDQRERERRQIGRPSLAEPFRAVRWSQSR